MPRRRHAGSTQTVPIQPTVPLTLRTLVPTTRPPASATNGRVSRVGGHELEIEAAIAPVLAQEGGRHGLDVGRRHRADARGGHDPILSAPGPDDPSAGGRHPRYHRRMATLSRSDVEHVAHLARLGLTDAELTRLEGELNHILDQYAILAELPTDDIPPTAQTIELENILREDVVRPSLPGRGGPRQRAGPRRRLHRGPGRSSTRR